MSQYVVLEFSLGTVCIKVRQLLWSYLTWQYRESTAEVMWSRSWYCRMMANDEVGGCVRKLYPLMYYSSFCMKGWRKSHIWLGTSWLELWHVNCCNLVTQGHISDVGYSPSFFGT